MSTLFFFFTEMGLLLPGDVGSVPECVEQVKVLIKYHKSERQECNVHMCVRRVLRG